MKRILPDVIAAIWSQADIVEVVQANGVRLRASGREYIGLCPFHVERTPSFNVNSDRKLFHCFGCGLGGDVFKFLSVLTGRSFPDVVLYLAQVLGIRVDGSSSGAGTPHQRVERTARPSSAAPRLDEVVALWQACRPVTNDAVVAWWLENLRGIGARAVEREDLARALPTHFVTPRWAWAPAGDEANGGRWSELGYRLLVPLYDATGHMAGVRARRVFVGEEPRDGRPKSLAPVGSTTRSLVMANPRARDMLAANGSPNPSATAPRVLRRGLWICEGEPDCLALAAQQDQQDDEGYGVLGIVAGSWTSELARRIPDGTIVGVATHGDAAGDRYAQTIADTFAGCGVDLRRWAPQRGPA